MNTLKRVILINSGGYSELEVPCDGHVQIVGMNGHGKTTLLRAILFFYVGNNENASFGIHTTQSDFASHYLGDSPSYLIYEVQRSGGAHPFHIAVSRPSSRVQFLFVDDAYDESIYIDPTRVVRSLETVRGELDSRLIAHDTQSSYEGFRHTIYGVRKSPYTVFRSNPRASQQVDLLPRIISGIFTVNRMDASRLKRALCCGLIESPQSLRIDLRQLRNNLSDFQRINRAVSTYLNNQRIAESILDLADQYEEFSEQLERLVRDFVARSKAVPDKETEHQGLKAEAEANLTALKDEYQKKEREVQEKLDDLKDQISKLEVNIERGEKREQEYREKRIEEKAAAIDTIPVLRQKLAEADAHYKALTGKYEDESKRRDELLSSLKQAKDEALFRLEKQKSQHQNERHRELESLRQKLNQIRRLIEEEEEEKLNALTPLRKKLNAKADNVAGSWKLFHAKKEPDSLRRKREEHGHLKSDLATWESRLESISSEAKVAQARHETASKTLEHEREKLDETLAREKKTLDEERQSIRADLDSMEKSIAGLIRRDKPQWLPTASRTLARSFIFRDAASLEAGIDAGAESLLLGLKLNEEELEKLEAVEVDPSTLECRLAENQSIRDDFAKRAEELRAEIDVKRDALEKQRRQQVEGWDAEKHDLEKRIRNGTNAKIDLSNTITNLENRCESDRKDEETRIRERENMLETQRRELDQNESGIRSESKLRREKAQDDEEKERNRFNEQVGKRLGEVAKQIEDQGRHYKVQSEVIETEFLKQLGEKGANPEVINEADTAKNLAAKALNEVEDYRLVVEQYQQHKREDIDPLPSWRNRRLELGESIETIEKERRIQFGNFSKEEKTCSELINKLTEDLNAISRDKNEIESFRKDPIAIEYLGLFADKSLEPAADYLPGSLRELVQTASGIHNQLHGINKNGDSLARKFLNKFEFRPGEENDLGFTPIPDGFMWNIFVVDQLRSFVRLNKIQRFRTLQTKQFDSIISQIVREVSRIEDALRQVKATARRVQEDLAQDKFIDVLDAIELRVQDEPSELWNQLKKIERFQNISFGTEIDLFQQQADDSLVKEAIRTFEALVKKLEKERRDALELEDSFEFAIRVIENGHDHGFRASLDHIGSTGTDYLVKMLIYLSLIDLIRGQALAGEDQAYLHCILDETGVLAPKYVKEAIRYAERKRIFLITAGHSATSKGFRYWFRVRKRGQYFGGEQIISKRPICE
ncbi:ATP-binding protein [Coraliomargarita sp. SDUM461004]|uniref:ATP-binding protein n=1 Tax=Thalassobacterium sedimentorum TaxID=3041258 RepID=A0ABU1ALK2_9BACT|nr:ATP-binding protein [Coraliomargarita sp. SDUM461004]MDQ8195680.1 ATP-binding protein [Coraliomargarita sp. SDUM461004]